MVQSVRISRAVIAALAIACAFVPGGCGGSEQATATNPQKPPVDPRYASAEALLAYYNQLSTATPMNARAMNEFIFAENDLQRLCVQTIATLAPIAELDWAMHQRLNEGWAPGDKTPMLAPEKPATFTQNDGARAQAAYISNKGRPSTLYLVKVGDRWWVSGYTFEYDPQFQRTIDFNLLDKALQPIAEAAPQITARVNKGEFKTRQQVLAALAAKVMEQNPSAFDDLTKSGFVQPSKSSQ